MHSLGILLSGRGSNFVAIADSIDAGRIPDARIAVVISNKADAPGIATARERGLNALVIPSKGKPREEHDREVVAALKLHGVDLVCLAGYMRLLSPWFVQQFPRGILNIHPSLLPAFPGLEAQEQAFAYGVKVSGCTVHFVDEELDHGAIIVQKAVPVLDGDDEHTLAARILEQEHVAYGEAINMVLGGQFEIVGRRLVASQKSKCRSKRPGCRIGNRKCRNPDLCDNRHSMLRLPALMLHLWAGSTISKSERNSLRCALCGCTGRFRVARMPESLVDNFCVQAPRSELTIGPLVGRSRAEFVAKLEIVLEEADETVFWLELLQESGIVSAAKLEPLVREARELTAIFAASICTTKGIAS